MKAFLDRNHFPYKHDLKYKAKAVGLLVVANTEGIEDTLHALNQFVDWNFDIRRDRKFIVYGYANKLGEVYNNTNLVEEAKHLGKQMVASLKDGD
jgi:multimeric flavodoxin WrbA